MDDTKLTPNTNSDTPQPSRNSASLEELLSWADSALDSLEQGRSFKTLPSESDVSEAATGQEPPAECPDSQEDISECPDKQDNASTAEPEAEDEKPAKPDRAPEEPDGQEYVDYNDDELLRGYVWDEETGRLYRVDERSRRVSVSWVFAICLAAISICGAVISGATLLPVTDDGNGSILSSEQYTDTQPVDLPENSAQTDDGQQVTEYIPAEIVVDGETVATMASTEAAHALLEDVKAYFHDSVSGEGEKESRFEDQVEILPLPNGADRETSSYDELFARFTGKSSPIRVRTTLTRVETKVLPYETDTRDDSTLIEGTRMVVTMGREGSETLRTSTVYINGDKSTSRSGTSTETIKPVDMLVYEGREKLDTEEDSPGRHEGERGPDKGELTFIAPVQGEISCNFGQLYGVLHLGLDYSPEKDDVLASAPGTVVTILERGSYGLMLEIDHGGGFVTRYAHLDSVSVAIGDSAQQGQVIATVGSSGNVNEKTLHFEIRVDGVAYNPRYYLD